MSQKQDMFNVAGQICSEQSLTLIKDVGSGAFKQTFLVETSKKQKFALKVYFPSMEQERQQREVDAIRACDHRNIAKIFSFNHFKDDESEIFWLLEEFLEGGTLTSRIEKGEFHRENCVLITRDLIDAIAHMHGKALVHRDIKPDNIMFRSLGNDAVIVDFGLVRDLSKVSVTATWQMHGPGTYYFAAPEQINNEKSLIDWRADQFALGVVLSTSILKIHPYDHGEEKMHHIIRRVSGKGEQSKAFIKRAIDFKLPQLIKMTCPWPVERYRTPDILLQAWAQD